VFARNPSTFKLLVDGGVMHGNKVFSSEEVQQFVWEVIGVVIHKLKQ
jgi:hypothetical protein